MVHRIYTERKDPSNPEVLSLLSEFKTFSKIRILNRYDIQGVNETQLSLCRDSIFSEPFTDRILTQLPTDADKILAVEFLPGQYDQRADSAEQCAGLLLGFRPTVRTAKVYLFYGEVWDFESVRKFLINPVEAREAQLEEYESLNADYPTPEDVKIVDDVMSLKGLAMSREDLECVKEYFDGEKRKPTVAEIKVLDTYWSDHCRHTTFTTHIVGTEIADAAVNEAFILYCTIREELNYAEGEPMTLMDVATIGAKYLKHKGQLTDLVESEENNACTVRVNVDGESWLLLFKNETHNHPTEIEPFGGAATCIGGAIRDPLSGRGYVYQAMRITGAADPFKKTIPGKLPQRSIITKAAQGYSSYGNQIGIPTGIVREIYHEGYRAKRLEIGAVIAAVREADVVRETPKSGDVVLLLGGRTGRDGIGGATGSSVSHTSQSIETCGAEVQKGNAPEERKLQRLFRNPEFTRLIKRCNDFGAGGVSVAVGELADGLEISLDSVPLKYSGLDGTEIAVSESQERMAVVVAKENAEKLKALALDEDVEATVIATVNDSGRMRMNWRGKTIVNLSRDFIATNGASRGVKIKVNKKSTTKIITSKKFPECLSGLNNCSQRGLSDHFDSTVGNNTTLMPLGGKFQKTPTKSMSAKITNSNKCSLMSWGFNPYTSEASPFLGAYLAVLEALCGITATGGELSQCWLTLQEYFGKPENDSERWGLPFGALLGALKAQCDFGVAAIGGKDSMSGTFETADGERLDVPPTLVAFAVSVTDVDKIISPEFKKAGSTVIVLEPDYDNDLPTPQSMKKIFADIKKLNEAGKILACSFVVNGDIKSEIFKMCLGNNLGFEFSENVDGQVMFIVETSEFVDGRIIGHVISEPMFDKTPLSELEKIYDSPLSEIFPTSTQEPSYIPTVKVNKQPRVFYSHKSTATPKFLIPVFAGTNCEYETARAIANVGGNPEIFVVRSLTPELMKESTERFADALKNSQALVIPGGFSNGDEPDGSGKFIAIFLRSPKVKAALEDLLNVRGGLVCGICNGFQALMKTGLLPHGKILKPDELTSTLTFNRIGRHQSRIIRSKVITNDSPWLRLMNEGEVYSIPISHGEGRFLCDEDEFRRLMSNGQIAGQYVDELGNPSMLTENNPSGSCYAVECITSPDGRVLGRMGHVERTGEGLYVNVPGNYGAGVKFFRAAVNYFK